MRMRRRLALAGRATAGMLAACLAMLNTGSRARAEEGNGWIRTETDEKQVNAYSDFFNDGRSGNVWADRSVYTAREAAAGLGLDESGMNLTDLGEEEFAEVFSVLGSSERVSGTAAVPADVVFVIDVSSSMGCSTTADREDTRIARTVAAVNRAAEQLIEADPGSRLALVVYGSDSMELVPLGEYDRFEADYALKADWRGPASGGNFALKAEYRIRGQTEEKTAYLYNSSSFSEAPVDAAGFEGMTKGNCRLIHANTNLDAGLTRGMEILAGARDVTAVLEEKVLQRVPVVIAMTDGGSNRYLKGEWYNPDLHSSGGQPPSGSSSYTDPISKADGDTASIVLKTLMTAAYMKSAVEKNYGTDAKVYTVAMDVFGYSGRGQPQPLTADEIERELQKDFATIIYQSRMLALMDPRTYFTGDRDVLDAALLEDYNWEVRDGKYYPDHRKGGMKIYRSPVTYTSTDSDALTEEEWPGRGRYRKTRYTDSLIRAYEAWSSWLGGDGPVTVNGITDKDRFAKADSAKNSEYTKTFPQLPDKADRANPYGITKEQVAANLLYSDQFYFASSDSIIDIFGEIAGKLTGSAFHPVSDTADGSKMLTYTDPIGEGMRISSIRQLRLFGETFEIVPERSGDGRLCPDAYTIRLTEEQRRRYARGITNMSYGAEEGTFAPEDISIRVCSDEGRQTLVVRIPEKALPIRLTELSVENTGEGLRVTERKTNYDGPGKNVFSEPLRLIYTVGPRESAAARRGNGEMSFYASSYVSAEEDEGAAFVHFCPDERNPCFYAPAGTEVRLSPDGSSYVYTCYDFSAAVRGDAGPDGSELILAPVLREISAAGTENRNGVRVIKEGARRDYAVKLDKGNGNRTGTARLYCSSRWDDEGIVMFLGNNGRLRVRTPRTEVVISGVKRVTDAAGNPLPEYLKAGAFRFELYAAAAATPADAERRSERPGEGCRATPADAERRSEQPDKGCRATPADAERRPERPGEGHQTPPAPAGEEAGERKMEPAVNGWIMGERLQTVENLAGGEFAFAPLIFDCQTAADGGTFRYLIREAADDEPGQWIYDQNIFLAEVKVSVPDGQMEGPPRVESVVYISGASGERGDIVFTNLCLLEQPGGGSTGNSGGGGDEGEPENGGDGENAGNDGSTGNSGDGGDGGNAGNGGNGENAENGGSAGPSENGGNAGRPESGGSTGNSGNGGNGENAENGGSAGPSENDGNAARPESGGSTGNSGNGGSAGQLKSGGNAGRPEGIDSTGNVGDAGMPQNGGDEDRPGNFGGAGPAKDGHMPKTFAVPATGDENRAGMAFLCIILAAAFLAACRGTKAGKSGRDP